MTTCDECGRTMDKVHRNYKGHRYCSTCYYRVFKHLPCPSCGELVRLPKNIPGAKCRVCENNQPCIRCGKESYKISKITPYGPVCGSCSLYFRAFKICALCGEKSRALSKVSRLNIDIPVCQRCATRDHGTCQACKKYRLLNDSSDGKMLCKKCIAEGVLKCPRCGCDMPAGLGKQCDDCYWRELLHKRIKLSKNAFTTNALKNNYVDFCHWLSERMGHKKASITINRFLHFFIKIESKWGKIPDYPDLMLHFNAKEMRRAWLVIKWMEDKNIIFIDNVLKESCADIRIINNYLYFFKDGTSEHKLINGFYKRLNDKLLKGKTSIRSIRLALTPAIALLKISKKLKLHVPDQNSLIIYLKKSPGQRAAISGFVGYLSSLSMIKLLLPKNNDACLKKTKDKSLELELIKAVRNSNDSVVLDRQLLSLALAYFHGLPKSIGKKIKNKDIEIVIDKGVKILWESKAYWVPIFHY